METRQILSFKNIDPASRRLIMIGLAIGLFISCLDITIVGTCANVIREELGDPNGIYAWLIIGYLLCESVIIPISGKLSDRYGRKRFFAYGVIIFVASSALAACSKSMEVLIIFRSLQGIGGGMLTTVAISAVADLYEPVKRGQIQAIISIMYGLGYAIGPVLGGFICDIWCWQGIFLINIPLLLICLIFIARQFPIVNAETTKKIDYRGMFYLAVFIVTLLLYFQILSDRSLNMKIISPESFTMIFIATASIILFLYTESKADDPVISLSLFKNQMFVKMTIIMFVFGIGFSGAATFISTYLMFAYKLSVLQCSLFFIPLVGGMIIMSFVGGKYVSKRGYRFFTALGSGLAAGGILTMSLMNTIPEPGWFAVYSFVFGLGLGSLNSVMMTAVQNTAKKDEVGMTTSAASLIRNLGSTIGSGLFAIVINIWMDMDFYGSKFAEKYPDVDLHGTGLLDLLNMYPEDSELVHFLSICVAYDILYAFAIAGFLFVIALGISWFIDSKYTVNND